MELLKFGFYFSFLVSDSPYSERMERKDSIRRFLREHLRDDKKSKENKEKDKESKENKDNKENSTNANTQTAITNLPSSESLKGSSTEVKTKSSAYRLFRTVGFN